MSENLKQVEGADVGMAYIDPYADFSVFNRVMVLDTYVAFRSGWQRDQRRGTRRSGINANQMARIKSDVSELFGAELVDVLASDDGLELAEYPDDDVLIIRAAIIDLDITAPDTPSAGRTRTFAATTGSATLFMELFDSVSGQIVGRFADRQTARSPGGQVTFSNRVTNTADARRMFRGWASQLRDFLDSHYTGETGED